MAHNTPQATILAELDEILNGTTDNPDQNAAILPDLTNLMTSFFDNINHQATDATSSPHLMEESVPQSTLENVKIVDFFTTFDDSSTYQLPDFDETLFDTNVTANFNPNSSSTTINSNETAFHRPLSEGQKLLVDEPPVVPHFTRMEIPAGDSCTHPYVIYLQSSPLPESTAAFSIVSREEPSARTTITSFQCDECHKMCSTRSGLTQHKNSAHGKARPYRCRKCGKTYESRTRLDEHQLKHLAENKPYGCRWCERRFAHKKDLNRHLQEHTKRLYQCSVEFCGKSFSRSDHMKSHERSHKARIQRIMTKGRLGR